MSCLKRIEESNSGSNVIKKVVSQLLKLNTNLLPNLEQNIKYLYIVNSVSQSKCTFEKLSYVINYCIISLLPD